MPAPRNLDRKHLLVFYLSVSVSKRSGTIRGSPKQIEQTGRGCSKQIEQTGDRGWPKQISQNKQDLTSNKTRTQVTQSLLRKRIINYLKLILK